MGKLRFCSMGDASSNWDAESKVSGLGHLWIGNYQSLLLVLIKMCTSSFKNFKTNPSRCVYMLYKKHIFIHVQWAKSI
jgi:hypothetical protein